MNPFLYILILLFAAGLVVAFLRWGRPARDKTDITDPRLQLDYVAQVSFEKGRCLIRANSQSLKFWNGWPRISVPVIV
jgi:hypothetical protein